MAKSTQPSKRRQKRRLVRLAVPAFLLLTALSSAWLIHCRMTVVVSASGGMSLHGLPVPGPVRRPLLRICAAVQDEAHVEVDRTTPHSDLTGILADLNATGFQKITIEVQGL